MLRNLSMARGWESKSVESQREDAQDLSDESRLSREELAAKSERISVERSLRRVEREMKETSSDARRESLRLAKEHLENELKKLGSSKS